MKAIAWSPRDLLDRHGAPREAADGVLSAAQDGERVRVEIVRSDVGSLLADGTSRAAIAGFREACVKAVEADIWPLAYRGRVVAEIHRRLDRVLASEPRTSASRSELASIYDYAGAWALAARLMQSGVRVAVRERESVLRFAYAIEQDEADVEIVLPSASPTS